MPVPSSLPKRTVVILGASDRPGRHSGVLFHRLLGRPEFNVVPVHPTMKLLEGIRVEPGLAALAPEPDLLTVYVNPDISRGLAEDFLRLRPKRVIFNPGSENPELEAVLERNGITVENACSLILLSQNEF